MKELLEAPAIEGERCTEQFGGPETATVKGTLNGAAIDASFTRNNGCRIARFDSAAPLWSRSSLPAA